MMRKVFSGAVAMWGRQIISSIINLIGMIFLSRLLTTTDFGLYAVLTIVITFLNTFGDLGLGASMVRQTEEPNEHEYAAVFTFQQIIIIISVIIFWLFAGLLTDLYQLQPAQVWIFRAAALSLLFTSFQVVPSISMERNLDFTRIAMVDLTQWIIYNIVAVSSALLDCGAMSFAYALLARSVAGTGLIFIMKPWHLEWVFDWKVVREHFSFSIPYQGVAILAVVSSAVNPTLMGLTFGLESAGIISFAVNLLDQMNRPNFILNRVLYPTLSRIRDDEKALAETANLIYAVTGFIHFGLLSLLAGGAYILVPVLYSEKWLPAIPLLFWLLAASVIHPIFIPSIPLINSLGNSRGLFLLQLIKTILFWILTIAFIKITHNYFSYAYAYILSESLLIGIYLMLKKSIPNLDAIGAQSTSFLASLSVIFILQFFVRYLIRYSVFFNLIFVVIFGAFLYLLFNIFFGFISEKFGKGFTYRNAYNRISNYISSYKIIRRSLK